MSSRSRAARRTKAQQREDMLEQILDAAEYLFSQCGLYGVTLKGVASEAGVNASLIHYYFEDKKAVFDAVFARRATITAEDQRAIGTPFVG